MSRPAMFPTSCMRIALPAALLLFVVSLTVVFGQSCAYYLAGPPSSVGDIQHQTVSPLNPSRTDIGIGEPVNCWIDPSTWSDTDICVDAEGNQTFVPDGMGTITWTCSGAGSVYPLTGDSTLLTADLTDSDDSVTVIATVPDSGTEGLDPALNEAVTFAIKAPKEIKVLSVKDNKPGTAPPPNAVIGFSHDFKYQVLPSNVDYGPQGGKVLFRENLPGDTWTWPDGTKNSTQKSTSTWNVRTDGAGNVNTNSDTVASGPFNTALLAGKDFSFTIRVGEDYEDENGAWVPFYKYTDNSADETHVKSYRGATLDGRGTMKTTVNSMDGGYMGPWKSIP